MRLDAYSKWKLALRLSVLFASAIVKLRGRRINIVAHRNADLDAVGAAFGVAELAKGYGVEPRIVFPEGPNRSARTLLESLGVGEWREECDSENPVITVDVANPYQVGVCENQARKATVIAVDHHKESTIRHLAEIPIIITDAASTSEIVAAIGWGLDFSFTPKTANILYAGIMSDTRGARTVGIFTFEALAFLHALGANPEFIARTGRSVKEPDTSERIAVLKALSRMILGRACKDILVTVSYVGSFESSAARAMLEAGSDVAIVARDTREGVRVSIRVSKRALDNGIEASSLASYIAEKYGGEGGGHPAAAMAEIRGQNYSAELVARELGVSLPGKIGRICTRNRELGGQG
ncbi:MAG: DHH family phosphoesterase [Desulfurococcales archaeon]|nr:DHH family phosphoesterase [Desulfurococcales archaeon]